MNVKGLVDEYTLKARVIPALVVILPYVQVLHSGQATPTESLNGLLLNGIFLFIVAHLVRGLGAKKQKKLYAEWSGTPTTILLRWRDSTLANPLKERYHRCLTAKAGVTLPNAQQENAAPDNVDDVYGSAVKWLLEQTRDRSKFYLVFQENISYGFWRNTLALKGLGIIAAVFSALLSVVDILRLLDSQIPYDKNLILSPILCLTVLGFWLICVREKQVKKAAYTYAKTLLAQCDAIGS